MRHISLLHLDKGFALWGSQTAVRKQPQAHDVGATGAWLTTLARARAAQRTLSAPPAALCGVPWQEGRRPRLSAPAGRPAA